MLQLYKNIKKFRKELMLTQSELASMTGYADKSMIAKIEKGEVDLPQSKITVFAQALQTTPARLMGWEEEQPKPQDDIFNKYDNIYPIELKKFPLLGEISCGEPIFATEDRESYIVAGADIKADFCLKAKGDSMINARILDGDIVFIRKQPMVDNGEIAAVIVDEEATLKRVYYYQKEEKLVLNAENPKYPPLVYVKDELDKIRILGKAIAFQSDAI